MFCRNCANEVHERAVACPKCGVNPRAETKFCPNCAAATQSNQVLCIGCGSDLLTSSGSGTNGKTVAIVAHLSWIGWIIALVLNNQHKSQTGSFYLRQTLGIYLFVICFFWIPFLNFLVFLAAFVLWVISLVRAINESKDPLPLFGGFQNWFKGL